MQVESIPSSAAARTFYEARYRSGYMDRWEAERCQRIGDVLAGVDLPPRPRILDYGCGSGALTAVLKQRWPDAEVVGVDISAAAIANARDRCRESGLKFEVLDEAFVRAHGGSFDLVWSHHVLEHVFDLDAALDQLVALVRPGGRLLHALPCGNAGSLPHWLCSRRRAGIDPAAGNRFYFEESSHLRRLTTDTLANGFAARGCRLVHEAYGYHHLGALRLFSEAGPAELVALFDPRPFPARCLPGVFALAAVVVLLAALRMPLQVLVRVRRLLQQVFVFRSRRLAAPASLALLALAPVALLLAPLSWPVEAAVRAADRAEWRRRRGDRRGAEMVLGFVRMPAADGAEAAKPAQDRHLLGV